MFGSSLFLQFFFFAASVCTKIPDDIIYQKTSVMLNLHCRSYKADDIYALWCSGVNIFNVDLTMNDERFLEDTKTAIDIAKRLNKPFYYRPIGLSVTMSIKEIFEVDDKVDIIILKGVQVKEELTEFRKKNEKHSSKPILLWITCFYLEQIKELIKLSDGVVIDLQNKEHFPNEACSCVLELCREIHRPIFDLKADVLKENISTRRMMITASKIMTDRLDGIMLEDSSEIDSPAHIVRELVTAIRILEKDIKPDEDYSLLSLKVKTPVIPNLAVALAASLAAVQSRANAMIVLSATGRSAHWVSCASPPCRVLAITTRRSTVGQMHLYRKILPLLYTEPRAENWRKECWNRVHFGTTFALTTGLFRYGAKLVLLAPSEEGAGYCNGFQIVSVPFRCNELMFLKS